MSILVRYAGIGFAGAYLMYIVHKDFKSLRILFSSLLSFFTALLIPIVPWFIYTRLNDVSSHDRKFSYELIPFAKLQEMFFNFGTWIFGNMNGLVFMAVAFSFLVLIYRKRLKKIKLKDFILRNWREFRLPFILSCTYFLFILFSAAFLDHAIPFSNRIFSPVYPFFLIGLGLFITFLSRQVSFRLYLLLPLLILISYSFRSIPVYSDHYKDGSGFTSVKFSESPTIQYLRKNYPNKIIYTNDVFIPKIFTDNKKIKHLPLSADSADLEKWRSNIKDSAAIVIYLDSVNWRNYIIKKYKVENLFKDQNIKRFNDGIIIKPEK
ncbi:hypothetical protein C7S20_00265 [Christiangramia fulva]|uniref:Glycosyltransferase RgtA/B/C/D-like domain-containing protein n=1 Tax=Christiangramia fulva TaxID=2126553 RepID=A0A2R3Z0P3_9FLAO|nr:hypothetical protein C7S20_00265 [Christiangramia fulva]